MPPPIVAHQRPMRDFFVFAGRRVWAHPGCMLKDCERVVESGDLDDQVIAINSPD